jgi:methyl-accepting chemotaxis protein
MLRSMSISTKLYALVFFAVLLSLVMVANAIVQLREVEVRIERLTTQYFEDMILIQNLRGDLLELSLLEQHVRTSTDASERSQARGQVAVLTNEIASSLEVLADELWIQSGNDELLASIYELRNYIANPTTLELNQAQSIELRNALTSVSPLADDIMTRVLAERAAALKLLKDARLPIVIGPVASIFVLALLAGYLVRSHVVRPLSELSKLLEEVAGELDFTRRHAYQLDDEIGKASSAFNVLMEQVQGALRELSQNTTQVAGGATQASNAIGQVAEGAQTQIDDLNQIADAMQQTSLSITEAAQTTREASQQAAAAAALVDEGRKRMDGMLRVSRGIAEDSKRINRISDAITRIANETHMLSLNASIEAARAGDQGKGFAVVAQQVGQLAEDAAESAQEILALAKQAEADAARSVESAETLGRTMVDISERVLESDAMVRSVATAVEEQRASVARIEVNVGSLREIGQGNATAAEEITATMIELSKLAQRSREQVDRFKTT